MSGQAARSTLAVGHAILVGLCLLAHFALHPSLAATPWAPHLLITGLMLSALWMRAGRVALLGAGLGLLEGAMTLTPMGGLMIAFAVAGYLAARARETLYSEATRFLLTLVFLGVVALQAVQMWLSADVVDPGRTAVYVIISGMLSALLAAGGERLLRG